MTDGADGMVLERGTAPHLDTKMYPNKSKFEKSIDSKPHLPKVGRPGDNHKIIRFKRAVVVATATGSDRD